MFVTRRKSRALSRDALGLDAVLTLVVLTSIILSRDGNSNYAPISSSHFVYFLLSEERISIIMKLSRSQKATR